MEKQYSEIRISIGTYTPTFDDLAISVHLDTGQSYMAIIDPLTFKAFLDKMLFLIGKNNPGFFRIPIIHMDKSPDHENFRKYISDIGIDEEEGFYDESGYVQ